MTIPLFYCIFNKYRKRDILYYEKTINSICKSTKELIIIRTFLGNKKIRKLFKNKKYVDRPYFINQFKVSWIKKKLESFNFKNIEIIKDNATKGKVRSIYPGLKKRVLFNIVKIIKNFVIEECK